MFTVDKYQQVSFPPNSNVCMLIHKKYILSWISPTISLQIGFFPNEKAFSLRYQTAGMLDTVLREGVLGEDDTGEEFPK